MSSIQAFLKFYFLVNFLLIVAFLLFQGFRALLPILKLRATSLSLLRAAQSILVACMLVPLALSFLPERALPLIRFQMTQPPSEDGVPVLRKSKTTPTVAISNPLTTSLKPPIWSWNHIYEIVKHGGEANSFWILLGLLAGFVISIFRLSVNIYRLRRLIAEAIPIRRLGRVALLISNSIGAPFSTRPGLCAYIVLPMTILDNARDFRIAVLHELQHHRQGDTVWAFFVEIWICLFYANPAIYLWKREIIELQEFSCDEALIGQKRISPHDYGSCLARVAEAALKNRIMFVGTACMAAGSKNPQNFKSFLRRRIEMFYEYQMSRRRKSIGIILGTLSIVGIAAVAYGTQQAIRQRTTTEPNPGQVILDSKIQAITQDVLRAAVQKFKAKAGFVLVSDPRTGKLLAVANFSHEATRDQKPWALSYLMEPASVMKGLVTAAAVDAHVTTFDEVFDCGNGEYHYGHNQFHDWRPFSLLSVTSTLLHSSNICGIKIGQRLGPSKLAKTVSDFGFGAGGTTEGFPGAMAGEIPTPEQLTEEEYVGLISTGYSLQAKFNVTPLEMLHAYGAIANDGQLMKPIAASAPDSAAQMVRQVLSAETAKNMKSVLAKVVTEGTGKPARSELYTMAGKTATAYTPNSPDHDSLGGERAVASFAGFAPVDHPRVAIYVGMIAPKGAKDGEPHGGEHAAPVFRDVAEKVLQYFQVPSDLH